MFMFLSVALICATVLYWSHIYLTPHQTPVVDDKEDITDVEEDAYNVNFDKVIAEIYERLDNE